MNKIYAVKSPHFVQNKFNNQNKTVLKVQFVDKEKIREITCKGLDLIQIYLSYFFPLYFPYNSKHISLMYPHKGPQHVLLCQPRLIKVWGESVNRVVC